MRPCRVLLQGRGLRSFPFPLNLSLLCPIPLNLSLLCNPSCGCVPKLLKLSPNVRDVIPRVLKLSCEAGECKPLLQGPWRGAERRAGGEMVAQGGRPRPLRSAVLFGRDVRPGEGRLQGLASGKTYLELSAAQGDEDAIARLKELRKCVACGKLDVHHMICSRCRKVRFCGAECQLQHWNHPKDPHKLHCKRRREAAGTGESSSGRADPCADSFRARTGLPDVVATAAPAQKEGAAALEEALQAGISASKRAKQATGADVEEMIGLIAAAAIKLEAAASNVPAEGMKAVESVRGVLKSVTAVLEDNRAAAISKMKAVEEAEAAVVADAKTKREARVAAEAAVAEAKAAQALKTARLVATARATAAAAVAAEAAAVEAEAAAEAEAEAEAVEDNAMDEAVQVALSTQAAVQAGLDGEEAVAVVAAAVAKLEAMVLPAVVNAGFGDSGRPVGRCRLDP